MEIRLIENKDIIQLLTLAIEMFKNIDNTVNEFGAINTIMHYANNEQDFTAIGLYDEDKLVGFVTGHCFSKKVFYFSGIYVIIKNNKSTKDLIEYSFDLVAKKGYSAWMVDATNGNISSIMEKYGAVVKHTRYYKEIA